VADAPLRVIVLGRSVYALHGIGGLERHLYDLVRHHLSAGWQVTLITRTPADTAGADPGRWREIREHPRCDVRFVPYRTFPLAGRAGTTILDRSTAYPWFGRRAGALAARLVRDGGADIVYGVGASVWGYDRRRRALPAPLVFNPQGLEEFGGFDGSYGGRPTKGIGYAPLRRVVRQCAAQSDAVIATDKSIVPIVTRHLPMPPERVHLVPNGIDVADLDRLIDPGAAAGVRQRIGIMAETPLLVSVGRLEDNKGFADLATALSTLDRSLQWHWTLIGGGPARASLVDHFRALGIADRVFLAGRTDDPTLHAWYEAADLFVHPTRYEGSSLVTLEAMLHRKPVLATRAGGLPDKVLPGRTGWLTTPASPESLASALRQALRDRQHWRAFGDAGRRLLEDEFDWARLQPRFDALYRSLLDRHGAVPPPRRA
jgi:glycosyltransferase involved in cell wall biosynthesis